jgi:hypothetical protein
MSYMSNQYGRLSKCSVRLFPLSELCVSDLPFPHQLGKCFVRPLAFCPCLDQPHAFVKGFLPMIYTTVSVRWRTSSIQLPEEAADDTFEELSETQKFVPERLTGRRILLLWLPALCDLTGTTVRSLPLHVLSCRSTATHICATGLCSS